MSIVIMSGSTVRLDLLGLINELSVDQNFLKLLEEFLSLTSLKIITHFLLFLKL